MSLCSVQWRPSGGRGEYEATPAKSLIGKEIYLRLPSLEDADIPTGVRVLNKHGKARLRKDVVDRSKPHLVSLIMRLAGLPIPRRENIGSVEFIDRGFVISQITFDKVFDDGVKAVLSPLTANILNSERQIDLQSYFTDTPLDVLSLLYTGDLVDIPTEITRTVIQRVGQEKFRKRLIQIYNGTCPLSDIEHPKLLKASHAKPWAKCDPGEHLNPFNGFLLSANLDAAFDSGLFTIDETGMVVFSPRLSLVDRGRLGFVRLTVPLRPEHQPFLLWHREEVFKR